MGEIEPDRTEARSWMERWLGAGHRVSAVVLETEPFDKGRFRTFASDDAVQEQLSRFAEGGVASASEANAWLAQILDDLAASGAACLVVEDDLASRTDPVVARSEVPSAFIGDRVISWSAVSEDTTADAVDAMLKVGSGYPRNAFVVTVSTGDLGLTHGRQLPADFANRVASALLAVIVSAFDDESFLVWDRR